MRFVFSLSCAIVIYLTLAIVLPTEPFEYFVRAALLGSLAGCVGALKV